MPRVFLSHSSADKSFVEPIADLLGKNNCVYDKYTFEIGMKTIEEIFDSMERSDIFVYFISEDSLKSTWVRDELNRAEELLTSSERKIKQIYPLIIDSKITHSDQRIANFLRKHYNLQRVENYILAYRKILQQISKNNYETDYVAPNYSNSFYGRDDEISSFRKRIDSIDFVTKSAIVSGIPGIGKKSYIKQALNYAKIIKPYYNPITLSMPKNGCIDDLITIISEAGFGTYTIEFLSTITSMDEKIAILTELINKIQKYREIIILEDDETIVSLNGEIKYWFYNAIKESDRGVAILLTSTVNVQRAHAKNYPCIFFCNLSELDMSDRLGLLRSSTENLELDLSDNDRLYFKDCLTGYPPQIIFCAEMIKNEGLEYAKEHTVEIASMPERISSMILEKCREKCEAAYLDGILSVIAKMEIAPIRLINKICKINSEYQKALITLKQFSVCYVIGANSEYIKMNSFIENFVTRNKISIPLDIQKILDDELDIFNRSIDSNEELNNWEISELKFYLKSNLKNGYIKNSFLYSTVVLQSIIELYNDQKYMQVINLVNNAKESERYQYFDDSIIVTIERYYCQSLVKTKSKEFEAEVEFFAIEKKWVEYYFLKGFWYRFTGKYIDAERNLNKALEHNSNHWASKRELVIIYLSTQDYEAALELAKNNYKRNRDNLFHIQAYMECLLEQRQLELWQEKDLEEMLSTLKILHKTRSNPIYYQLMGKYEAYKRSDLRLAIEYIETGLKKHPNHFYLIRDKFDIYRRFNCVADMEKTLKQLSESMDDFEYKGAIFTRTAILRLHRGESVNAVKIYLQESGFSQKAIENIINRYSKRSSSGLRR